MARLTQARQRGGFIALKAHVRDAAAIREAVAALDGVTPVNVTAEFVRTLRAVVAEQGRPKWETVLAADSPDASPAARTGFTQLLQKTWTRLEEHIRAGGNSGIVLLHDATPLAGTRAAPSCSRGSRWPRGTRTSPRLACGCSAPWRTRRPRRNSTG